MRKLKINGVEIEVSDDCTIDVEGNKITILATPQIPGGLPLYPTPPYGSTNTQYGN